MSDIEKPASMPTLTLSMFELIRKEKNHDANIDRTVKGRDNSSWVVYS